MGGTEQSFVNRAFETNWIAPLGPNVDEFERRLSAHCAGRPVVALSSGTAALHLALVRLGVGAGDTVLCQSFTFCASANPVVYLGGQPVFIGSEAQTWNMCPTSLREALLSLQKRQVRPKAIIYVHLYGTPAKVDEIQSVAKEFDVPLIEDAAESLGSTYKGQPTGIFGRYGILSFNGNKIITTSGGGALVCETEAEANKIRFLSTQARDPAPYYLHSEIGYNYRLSNICAGIGCGQMDVLGERVAARRKIYERYQNKLKAYPQIEFLPSVETSFENRWLTAVTLSPELQATKGVLEVQRELETLNVETRPLWNPLHLQPVFKDCEYFGSGLESNLFSRGLCLPSSSSMSESEQDFVIEALLKSLGLRSAR